MNASVTAVHRANNFDALRLFAALLVIWGHQFAIMGRPVPLILGGNEPGAVGVVMFFAISGYLVTLSWLADPHLLRFAARRALRIWPALCVVVLLCIVVLGPLVTTLPQAAYWKSAGTWDYLSNIWLKTRYALPGVFDGNPVASSVNGPLWTIPLEVTCYAILAALGVCGITRTRWSGPAIFLILLILTILSLGLGAILTLPIMLVVGIGALVLIIMAAIKANDGVAYRYPFATRLVK